MKQIKYILISLVLFILIGCGTNTGTTTLTESDIGTGYYIDSAIEGVSYHCGSQKGTTDKEGKFKYQMKQKCTFSINDIILREVEADELFDGVQIFEDNVTVAQFLQSLDNDANATNGIKITIKTIEVLKAQGISKLPKHDDELKDIIEKIRVNNSDYNGSFITIIEVNIHLEKTKTKIKKDKDDDKEKQDVKDNDDDKVTEITYTLSTITDVAVSSSVQTVIDELNKIKIELDGVQTYDGNKLKQEYDKIKKRFDDVKKLLDDVKQSIDNSSSDKNSLKKEVDALKKLMDDLKKVIDGYKKGDDNSVEAIDDIKSLIDGVVGGMSNEEDEIEENNKYSISGYVTSDKINNMEISLYSDNDKFSVNIDGDGKYIFSLSEPEYLTLVNKQFSYIEAITSNNKKLRGLILGLNKVNNEYSGRDTYITYYSEALFRIKDALGLDLKTTKILYKDFLQSYKNGVYELNNNSYTFAFRDIIEELADNIKEHIINNQQLISHYEIINKIKELNRLKVTNFNKSKKYSFPLLSQEKNTTVLIIITFKDSNVTDDFTANMQVSVKENSSLYDKAILTKINFSDSKVILKSTNIKTFSINKKLNEVLYNDEYKEVIKNGDNSQIIKNNKIKLLLNNNINTTLNQKIYRKIVGNDSLTDIYYDTSNKPLVKLVFDTSKLNNGESHELYLNVEIYDESWSNSNIDSNIITLTSSQDTYYFDFTSLMDKFNGEDKHFPIKITLKESQDYLDGTITLDKTYGFIDWNNDYKDATIAQLTLKDTLQGTNTKEYGDNVFNNSKGDELKHINTTPTHRIIDFDKIVEKNILFGDSSNKPWKDTNYTINEKNKLQDNDTRVPLLLIHGWQGDDGMTYPSKLLRYENSEFKYWHNFISYYLATPEIYTKYKLYTYHYPSYKHITYNARMLQTVLQKVNTSSILGKGFTEDGMVIIGHSMGGLVARSFIEEHDGLGNNAERLIKLITLDTPHHGSPSSISNYVRTQLGDMWSKDLDTAGAVDLLWDNYDEKYLKGDIHFDETVEDINDNDSRRSRMNELDKYSGKFDDYYGNNLMNPYLKKLNEPYKNKLNTFAKDKYIIYTAITPYMMSDNKLKNPINNNNIMLLNTQFINNIGYASGGAEPACSSLLSFQTDVDNITRFTTSMSNLEYVPPFKKFIIIENEGNEFNRDIPYRIFWDYDHETIMNGQIPKGDSDEYIDEPKTISTEIENTNFSDLIDGFGVGTARDEYIEFATDYLFYNINTREVDENSDFITDSLQNPLKYEPVFLLLRKDLLDAIDEPITDNINIDPIDPTNNNYFFMVTQGFAINAYQPALQSNVNVYSYSQTDQDQYWILQDTNNIQRYGTDLCLNAHNPAQGSDVNLYGCDKDDAEQQWEAISDSTESNLIRLQGTSYCLNAHNPSNSSNLNLYTCNFNDPEQNFNRSLIEGFLPIIEGSFPDEMYQSVDTTSTSTNISEPNWDSTYYSHEKDNSGNYLQGYWYRGMAPRRFYDYSKEEFSELDPCSSTGVEALGNCTWYAKSRARELGANNIPYSSWGDASSFDIYATNAGFIVDNNPSVGSIAHANANTSIYGASGHVAVVEQVNNNGTIVISESSYAPCSTNWNFLYQTRTVSVDSFTNYIHVER